MKIDDMDTYSIVAAYKGVQVVSNSDRRANSF